MYINYWAISLLQPGNYRVEMWEEYSVTTQKMLWSRLSESPGPFFQCALPVLGSLFPLKVHKVWEIATHSLYVRFFEVFFERKKTVKNWNIWTRIKHEQHCGKFYRRKIWSLVACEHQMRHLIAESSYRAWKGSRIFRPFLPISAIFCQNRASARQVSHLMFINNYVPHLPTIKL